MAATRATHFVVGLGNPGDQYTHTRHNVGFCVLDAFAAKLGARFAVKRRLTSAIAEAKDDRGLLLLAKPLTFMNLSGAAVVTLLRSRGSRASQLLVVCDDADLPLGRLRLRGRGGSGGHRGLASIIEAMGGGDFARLRVGIGRQEGGGEGLTEHVLGRFREEERRIVQEAVANAVAAIECWRSEGLGAAMERFNARRKI